MDCVYHAIVVASIFRIRICIVILFGDYSLNHVGHDLIELGGVFRCNDWDSRSGLNRTTRITGSSTTFPCYIHVFRK